MLALTALVLVVAAVSRLAVLKRLRRRDQHTPPPAVPFVQAASPGYAAYGSGYPGPGHPGPGSGYVAANPGPSYPAATPGHPTAGPDRASASSD